MVKKNAVTKSDRVFKYQKKVFLKFLNENEIEYEQINYKNNKCNNYEYILNDIKNSDAKSKFHLNN